MASDALLPGFARSDEADVRVDDADHHDDGPGDGNPAVRVIRSAKRRKTSSARFVDGVVEVRIPAWMDAAQERDVVAELVGRIVRAREIAAKEEDLEERASRLADEYGLPRPAAIRWVGNQQKRWGSCTPATGEIRISSRLRRVPAYVLDYVIVHELAHLVEGGHGPRFKALEARYPRLERAEGFLDAMSLGFADDAYQAD
ncbi:MAG: M48 family metallopeptidase [Actinomycetota bacterium]